MSDKASAALASLSGHVAYLVNSKETWIWDGHSAKYYQLETLLWRESTQTPGDIEGIVERNCSGPLGSFANIYWRRIDVPEWFKGHDNTDALRRF